MFKLCITGDLGFEFWKDIPGYEGLYQASTYGRVRSLDRYIKYKFNSRHYLPCILKPIKNKYGYLEVCLSRKTFKCAKLISITFLPKWKPEYIQINHKDENKCNDNIENLEWCTPEYNTNYGTRTERAKIKQKNHPKRSKPVFQYDLQRKLINKFPSIKEARRQTGFAEAHIIACCKGKQPTSYGYVWKYA